MKIKNIKINSYGKLKNKEINLENINIIYGKNESGKSTLLNFIKNIFYGISKNKNGKNISDYDKYCPWEENNFSGKIKYELDNGNMFEVYRDFNKKSPEIYNENLEEISKEFKIDKKLGNQFFIEQTNIDEDTFEAGNFIMQKEIEINNNIQSNIIQKIANITESGTEDVSYKKAQTDLNSMLLNEVGTNNSKDRPINIVRENIQKYQNELDVISNIKDDRFYIENKINEIGKNITKENEKQILLNKIKRVVDENKIENEKIKIKNDILEENKNKIKKLDNEKDGLINKLEKNKIDNKQKNKNKKNKIINLITFIFLVIINIFNFIFIKNKIINLIIMSLIPFYIIYLIKKKINNNKISNNNSEKEIENKMDILDVQIEILEKNNEDIEKEILEIKNKISEYILEEKQNILNENYYEEGKISKLFNENIDLLVEENKEQLNKLNIELHKLELNRENINPELEKILNLEENIEIEKENLKNLEKRAEEFEIAKKLIEEAYIEMRKNVSPKFNENLSSNIEKISNGKYKKVIVNDGIVIELEDGRYVPIESLSIGTIEQIYLSLRLSVVKSLSKEKLPIMLDEVFSYYDDERLQSALEFLIKTNYQLVIFTCTNREKEILDKIGVEYNYINL